MGFYYDTSSTRHIVATNFGEICNLFRLNIQKLTDLSQPIAKIPYTKYRRLLLGERDITVEELTVLYELLGVPPTTFMYPWHIGDNPYYIYNVQVMSPTQESAPKKLDSLFEENPIFDYFGKSIYPYHFSDLGSWLAGQIICDTTSNSRNLYALSLPGDTDTPFRMFLQHSLTDYFKESFPIDEYEKFYSATLRFTSVFERNFGDQYLTDYLHILGKAVLWYSRLTAIENCLSKTSSNTDSITGSMVNHDVRAIWSSFIATHKIHQERSLTTLLSYVQLNNLNLLYQISSTDSVSSDTLKLYIRDRNDGHTIAHASIDFSYDDWFRFRCPPIKSLYQKGQSDDSTSPYHVISQGPLLPQCSENDLSNIQCLSILKPEFIE